MIEIYLQNWEEFEQEVKKLDESRLNKKEKTRQHISKYLFRGQSDSNWKLETTLERYIPEQVLLREYYKSIYAAKCQIETFTNEKWNIPEPPEFNDFINKQNFLHFYTEYGYDYLIYLRHHGFPSPLLDWTRSPYVAAFFAFNNVKDVEHVSIYAYQEYSGGFKTHSGSAPHIEELGPYIKSHERHFLQQSQYTICAVKDKKNAKEYCYYPHEEYFENNNSQQDLLWKFNIPFSEKIKVLKHLDTYNLNAFSLFGNEEGLMETVAFREIMLKNN